MPLLERLGLGTRPLRAWAMYDWANSAIFTVVVTAVFPTFYARVPAAGLAGADATTRYSLATTLALAVAVVLAPIVGAVADVRPIKKRILATAVVVGALACALLGVGGRGGWLWALVAFAVVNVAVNVSTVVYDALLPHLAPPDQLDRASSAGYALGYLGGGLALAIALLAILQPAWLGLGALAARDPSLPTAVAFVGTGAWWALFTLPLLRRVPEPPAAATEHARADGRGRDGARRLRVARRHGARAAPHARGVALPARVRDLQRRDQHDHPHGHRVRLRARARAGIAHRRHPARAVRRHPVRLRLRLAGRPRGRQARVLGALAVYGVITAVAYGLRTERDFWILAGLVATVQGGAQALSRSLWASLVPASRSGEFFGLFSVFNRFGGMLGPLAMAAITTATGSSRLGIVSVLAFFVVGAVAARRRARGRRAGAGAGDGPGDRAGAAAPRAA
jgi:UMF1 family MFS transporter